MTIPARLKQLINDNNMNLKEFSDKTEIPYSTLQGYFQETRRVGLDTLAKLAFFNVNLNWLITGNGKMYATEQSEAQKYEDLSKQERILLTMFRDLPQEGKLLEVFRNLPDEEKEKMANAIEDLWIALKDIQSQQKKASHS